MYRGRGSYIGTVIDDKWWKRYLKDKLFARGNGEYWYDENAFYFRRYLTHSPIKIPFDKVSEIKTGKTHAGQWQMGAPIIKLYWEKRGIQLSSGFLVSRKPAITESVIADLKERIIQMKDS